MNEIDSLHNLLTTFFDEGITASAEGRPPHTITITEEELNMVLRYTNPSHKVNTGSLNHLYGVPVQVLRRPRSTEVLT